VDQIKDLEAVDRRIAAVNVEIKTAVAEAPTRLTKLYGLGAINTARILGEVGDVARFKSRHHFASYNGTAPTVWGSGGPATPMVNPKGNRKLNHPSTSPPSHKSDRRPRPGTPTTHANAPKARPTAKRCAP
jgi:hypothetical protein